MRDPERLDRFYDDLKRIHKEHCPDWRISQLFCNLQRAYGSDLFYTEDAKFVELVRGYFEKS